MKKVLFLVGVMCTLLVNAQESEKFNVSFGLNYGFGENVNGYKLSDDTGFSYYEIPEQHSLGMDFGIFLTENIRFRIDLRYVKMGYGVDWSNDLYTIDHTEVNLYNFDLNFKIDYRLLNSKKFDLFITPGFITEYVVQDEHKSTYTDGSETYTTYNFYEDDSFPSTITGLSGSLTAKYKINDYVGITFSPEYTLFLRKFDSDNSGAYQRYGANVGVEFTF